MLRPLRNIFAFTRINCMSQYPKMMPLNSNNQDKQDVAVIRTVDNGAKFTFSFHLKTSKFGGIDKQFDMCRNVDEKVSNFLERLNANVEKVINKKAKKKKQAEKYILCSKRYYG